MPNKNTTIGNWPDNYVEQVQTFVKSHLVIEGITPMYAGLKLHQAEMVSLDGGLPKIFQQALLIDCLRRSNFVWDCGFSIKQDSNAMTGFKVSIEQPKNHASYAALLSLLYNSVEIAERLTPEPKTLELDILPVRPKPERQETLMDQFAWEDLMPLIAQREADYRLDQVQEQPQL